jgi:hypothetical protein
MIRVFLSALCLTTVFFTTGYAQQNRQWPPEITEVWEPLPPKVTPGEGTAPPSDAIVLFDGSSLDEWVSARNEEAAKWELENGAITVVPRTGDIQTKRSFGDCQLHIEFRTPVEVQGDGQSSGNSGIFLQGRYELQVLNNYDNETYVNGQVASIYKQAIPLVNASRPRGEWQTYDIIYTAPRFNDDAMLVRPAYITVLHNGVLAQNHVEIKGTTEYIGLPKYIAHGKAPLRLQDHGNRVSYRNIWIREL